jgi:hypothetical protein
MDIIERIQAFVDCNRDFIMTVGARMLAGLMIVVAVIYLIIFCFQIGLF